MTQKTLITELSGLPLNWVVALGKGLRFEYIETSDFWGIQDPEDAVAFDVLPDYSGSWAFGGELMDLENIGVKSHFDRVHGKCFLATSWDDRGSVGSHGMTGSTKLEAIARCFAVKRIGTLEIEIPKELLETV